jgi:hypothetical protein
MIPTSTREMESKSRLMTAVSSTLEEEEASTEAEEEASIEVEEEVTTEAGVREAATEVAVVESILTGEMRRLLELSPPRTSSSTMKTAEAHPRRNLVPPTVVARETKPTMKSSPKRAEQATLTN